MSRSNFKRHRQAQAQAILGSVLVSVRSVDEKEWRVLFSPTALTGKRKSYGDLQSIWDVAGHSHAEERARRWPIKRSSRSDDCIVDFGKESAARFTAESCTHPLP